MEDLALMRDLRRQGNRTQHMAVNPETREVVEQADPQPLDVPEEGYGVGNVDAITMGVVAELEEQQPVAETAEGSRREKRHKRRKGKEPVVTDTGMRVSGEEVAAVKGENANLKGENAELKEKNVSLGDKVTELALAEVEAGPRAVRQFLASPEYQQRLKEEREAFMRRKVQEWADAEWLDVEKMMVEATQKVEAERAAQAAAQVAPSAPEEAAGDEEEASEEEEEEEEEEPLLRRRDEAAAGVAGEEGGHGEEEMAGGEGTVPSGGQDEEGGQEREEERAFDELD